MDGHFYLLVLVSFLPLSDSRNDSYDTGIYLKAQSACLCGVIKKYTELEEKTLILPKSTRDKEPVKKYYDYGY